MISMFLLDFTTFVSVGILCVLPVAEMRRRRLFSPVSGPTMSRPPLKGFPAPAVIQPSFEFRLIKGRWFKRRRDADEIAPAWVLLYFIILAVLYLYHYDVSQVQTIYTDSMVLRLHS